MKSVSEQVNEVIQKGMVYDPLLAEADPSIIASRNIAFSDLTVIDLKEIYNYNYPQNVKWLIDVRPDFIQQYYPHEL
jgi:hypothetical protein